jgi:hypothetical protein
MKLCCCCGLWRDLDIEELNANPVHHAGTAKGSIVDRTPAAYRELAAILLAAGEEQFLFRLIILLSGIMAAIWLHIWRLCVLKSAAWAS